jgi:peptide/nickel transport system substrate-binding protein
MPDKQQVLADQESAGISRRKYLAITTAIGGLPLAGCSGGTDNTTSSQSNTTTTSSEASTETTTEQSNGIKGGTLRSTLESSVQTFDPAFAATHVSYTVGNRVMEKLFELNRDLEIVGNLAKDVTISEDGLTWDITLQEGVQFHPPYSRELTADDVVANFDRLTNPDVGATPAGNLSMVKDWTAPDNYTVRLTFDQKIASMRSWLQRNGMNIIPPEHWEEGDPKSHPVGTGPFKFEEWVTRDHITLSKFEDYWQDDLPHLDEVIFRPISESAVKNTELTSGNIHIVRSPNKDTIGQLEQNSSITVETRNSGGYRALKLNPAAEPTAGRGTGQPTKNRKIRQAIAEAVDREAMVQIVEGGYGTPTQSWWPETSPWSVDYAPYTMGANPEAAKELIGQTGFEPPVEVVIISSTGDDTLRQLGRITQSNLNNAGFDAQLKEMEMGSWVDALFTFEWDISPNYKPYQPDPDQIKGTFHPDYFQTMPYDGPGGQHWDQEAFSLWEQGNTTFDHEERLNIYTELQRLLIDDAVNQVLYHPNHVRAYRNTVKNYSVHPYQTSFELEKAWLDNN